MAYYASQYFSLEYLRLYKCGTKFWVLTHLIPAKYSIKSSLHLSYFGKQTQPCQGLSTVSSKVAGSHREVSSITVSKLRLKSLKCT